MHLLNAPQSTDQDPRMFEGLEFRNSHDVAIFAQEEDRDKIFPWVRHVEEWQALAILSLAAGFSGGVVRDIKAIYDRDEAHKNTWLIGLVLGPAILLVSVVYPAIIAEGKWQLRPASIIAVCFLGGVFAQQAWAYLQAAADKTFSRRNGT
jgi:hypothetical protein